MKVSSSYFTGRTLWRDNSKFYVGLRLVGWITLVIPVGCLLIIMTGDGDFETWFIFFITIISGSFCISVADIGRDISILLEQAEKQTTLMQKQLEVLQSFRKK